MPRLSQEAALDKLLAESRPESRFVDLCLKMRRLTLESAAPIPDDTVLRSESGVELKARTVGGVIITASTTPGESASLADGEPLTWSGGVARLRADVLATFGRRWDRALGCWSEDPPEQPLIFDLQESQVALTRRFVERFENFKLKKRDKHSLFVVDDRSGGKSLGCLMLTIGARIDFLRHPDGADFIVWILSVNHGERKELDNEIRRFLPPEWYRLREFPAHVLELAHGGTILLKSADVPDATKAGRVDLCYQNEAAKMCDTPYSNGFPRTKDRRGWWMAASNPPTNLKGEWINTIYERHEEARQLGKRQPVEFIRCSSALNVTVDSESNADVNEVLRWISPARADADGEGIIKPVGNRLYRPPFDLGKHIKHFDPAEWASRDITQQVCRDEWGGAFDWIVSADFQNKPGAVGLLAKVFGPRERPTFWILADYWSDGDEDDMCDDILADHLMGDAGKEPRTNTRNTIIVGDCSGDFQDGEHSGKGKTSFAVFRNRGFRIVPNNRPVKNTPGARAKNPSVERTLNRVYTAFREDRILIDHAAEQMIWSLKECGFKRTGNRIRATGLPAHMTDALRYLVWACTPPLRPANAQRPKIWSSKK